MIKIRHFSSGMNCILLNVRKTCSDVLGFADSLEVYIDVTLDVSQCGPFECALRYNMPGGRSTKRS